ncbi:MAG: hypothetical protein COA96_17020 [SAR86 cluster bacterium]|uniref:Uncharacterized protein n=1 Tax=SAR86 cluster bacterium TaxID=2030880 RepID=A0A2A5AGW6_9GAMM|nr:MAG: hypothetical protein COA96_17020 [SAR86 cluster bacterium]
MKMEIIQAIKDHPGPARKLGLYVTQIDGGNMAVGFNPNGTGYGHNGTREHTTPEGRTVLWAVAYVTWHAIENDDDTLKRTKRHLRRTMARLWVKLKSRKMVIK